MNPEVLKTLRASHLPEPISWWPPAIGWWLILVAIALVCVLVYFAIKRKKVTPIRKNKTWKKTQQQAQSLWQKLHDDFEQNPERSVPVAVATVALIKRVSLQHPNANDAVAGMAGEAWLLWLNQQWNEKAFEGALGNYFLEVVYKPEAAVDEHKTSELLALCKRWLEAQKQWR